MKVLLVPETLLIQRACLSVLKQGKGKKVNKAGQVEEGSWQQQRGQF